MALNSDNKVRQPAEAIKAADALLITAGAGMGVDSGLPDFRGAEGFWRAYPAIAKLRLSFEEMANPAWFSENPHLAWAFYGHRLNLYRQTTPHHGFSQLLELGRAKAHGYFALTSNVDGQFQHAGFAPERMVECHGSIHHFQCTAPCTDEIWDAEGETVKIHEITFRAPEPLPKCRNCSALARPKADSGFTNLHPKPRFHFTSSGSGYAWQNPSMGLHRGNLDRTGIGVGRLCLPAGIFGLAMEATESQLPSLARRSKLLKGSRSAAPPAAEWQLGRTLHNQPGSSAAVGRLE